MVKYAPQRSNEAQQRETIFGTDKTFSEKACIIDHPKMQGIIEVHEKITKHITLASKK